MSETAVPSPPPTEEAAFDDVMLAMDIVDTLRHRALVVEKELSADDREAALIERLREIYHAQGIEVPDHILKDGVKALEEKRFVYEPKHGGFQVALAKLYVNRGRWFRPLAIVLGLAGLATGLYEFGIDAPRERAAAAARIELTETLPASLADARDAALALAETDGARRRIETAYQDGAAALSESDASRRAQSGGRPRPPRRRFARGPYREGRLPPGRVFRRVPHSGGRAERSGTITSSLKRSTRAAGPAP